jgi:hypothetical protein
MATAAEDRQSERRYTQAARTSHKRAGAVRKMLQDSQASGIAE